MTRSTPDPTRRLPLQEAAARGLAVAGGPAVAQAFHSTPHQRCPDPAVLILDPGFARCRIDT